MEQHTAIVVRAPSIHKQTVTLFDSTLGKVQAVVGRGISLSHGALVSYRPERKGMRYFARDLLLLRMPFEWARENFLFFHHVLELCDHFVPWEVQSEGLYSLVFSLYNAPQEIATLRAQQLFLYSFYQHVGVYEPGTSTFKEWLAACLHEHPQILLFKTAGFLKLLEGYEEPA